MAIDDGEQGFLVDFFDTGALVDAVDRLLEDGVLRKRLASNARVRVRGRYDLNRYCLPRQMMLIEKLATGIVEVAAFPFRSQMA